MAACCVLVSCSNNDDEYTVVVEKVFSNTPYQAIIINDVTRTEHDIRGLIVRDKWETK